MEEDIFLTEAEEQVVDAIRSVLYSESFSLSDLQTLLSTLAGARRSEVLKTAFIGTSAEQAQRRNYIALTMFPKGEIDETAYGVLANGLNQAQQDNKLADLGRRLGVAIDPATLTSEVLEQAKIYSIVEKNLSHLGSQMLYEQKVKPLLPLVATLPPQDLATLIKEISVFIDRASTGQGQDLLYDPELPKSISDLLDKAKLSITADGLEGLGEKISFLMTVLTIAQGIVRNNETGAFSNSDLLGQSIAELLYLYGNDFEYVL